MSYIGNRVQCDQCGTEIPVPFPAGMIILMEVPADPMRAPVNTWQIIRFHNLQELKAWASDAEQSIEAGQKP